MSSIVVRLMVGVGRRFTMMRRKENAVLIAIAANENNLEKNTKLAALVFVGQISQVSALWRVTDAQVTETWPKMGSDEPLLLEK